MGEMADYFLESVYDYEEAVLDYMYGYLSDQEALERGVIDECGAKSPTGPYLKTCRGAKSPTGPYLKTCRYCGKTNLYWTKTNEGWRLAGEGGSVRNCPEYKGNKQ